MIDEFQNKNMEIIKKYKNIICFSGYFRDEDPKKAFA